MVLSRPRALKRSGFRVRVRARARVRVEVGVGVRVRVRVRVRVGGSRVYLPGRCCRRDAALP